MRFHKLNVLHNWFREEAKRGSMVGHVAGVVLGEKERSPLWSALEKEVKRDHPSCASCASKVGLNVHHIKPFHLHPELELETDNLIVLCMDVNECHLLIGHGDNFKAYNADVVQDAAMLLAHPELRAEVVAKAKANRLMQ